MNAVNHGLTSARVLPDEVQMVDDFIKELADYYAPESPLEVLQIQRIAFCRAKLAKLIDIELAGRQLSRKAIEQQPDAVMARLKQFPDNVRRLAIEIVAGRAPLSTFA